MALALAMTLTIMPIVMMTKASGHFDANIDATDEDDTDDKDIRTSQMMQCR